jgi:pimeloyl-ACP methyl ester carboxylesterase
MNFPERRLATASTTGLWAVLGIAAAAGTAVWVQSKARRAEKENLPRGQFVEVDGVRLHYRMRGDGPPVVLLHGNAVTVDDFEASGLVEPLSRDHRVIAFDRPGFGHSQRPRGRAWTVAAQAALIHKALRQLGITQPAVVIGHSMGTMVALAMALDFPESVAGLVLVGGYYYPSLRVDSLLTAPVAWPVVGDAMRYTVTALTARALLRQTVKGMFAPNDVPTSYLAQMPRELMLRPLQLRSNAEDGGSMMAQARSLSRRYGELRMPITLVAGAEDRVVDPDAHTARLHRELGHSQLVLVPQTGHMAHHFAKEQLLAAVAYVRRSLGSQVGTQTAATLDARTESEPQVATERTPAHL